MSVLREVFLIIPMVPANLNNRMHWAEKYREKSAIEEAVYWKAFQVGAKGMKLERAAVEVTYIFPTNRRRDYDNYAPKQILDGLVKAGVLVDDSAERVKVTWGFGKGDRRETVIVVREVE